MSDQDKVLDHSYDGIQEYDNRLPNWWLYTLYGAMVFAFGYWLFYHTYDMGQVVEQDHMDEMAVAARLQLEKMADQELTNESLALMASVPESVGEGREVFNQFCVVCHGQQGEGSVGPNLTDAYWIHGADPMDILKTVNEGVPDKGMAAWAGQLGPRRVQNVVAFVLTLQNTNVPGKDPEGELVSDEDAQAVVLRSGR